MNYAEEILHAIFIAVVVANFLLNTSRALKAIELCRESLVLLSNKVVSVKKPLRQRLCGKIYHTLFKAYRRLSDHTNAIACGRKLLNIHRECGDTVQEAELSIALANIYQSQSMYAEAKELYERAISVMQKTGDRGGEEIAFGGLGTVFRSLGKYVKAKEYYEKALAISMEIGDRAGEGTWYGNLGNVFGSLGEYVKAKEYYEKALAISMEIGDRANEGKWYGNLGNVFGSLSEYVKAKEYFEKALAISMEIGDRENEGTCYGNLGNVFHSLGEYAKAKEYYEKALAISMKIGDRAGEGTWHGSLGNVFFSLGEYVKAKEYYEKALAISMEIGDRALEGTWYGSLGNVFGSLGEYVKAKEYYEKVLAISMEIGDRAGEGAMHGSLGNVFFSLGEYVKAKEYYEKALAISMEIGDRENKGTWYGNLGNVFRSLGEYVKAKEYFEKALAISMEIGDRAREGAWYGNLGTVFGSLGEYVKAKEYYEKALAISMEIGDRKKEGVQYGNLGNVFGSLGEYVKAKEYFEKALAISMEIGDQTVQAKMYLCLANVLVQLEEYGNSKLSCDNALAISMKSGHKETQAGCYLTEGHFHKSLGDKDKARACYKKALAIALEIGDRENEAESYLSLGKVFLSAGDHNVAEEYLEKALSISENIGEAEIEFSCLCILTMTKLVQHSYQEAFSLLSRSVVKSETMRGFLQDSDQMKISFVDMHVFPYQLLCEMFRCAGNPKDALYVAELGRARALADLMATQYSVENRMSADPQSWTVVENVMKKESDSTCLYISYFDQTVFLWILKTSGSIQFRKVDVDKKTLYTRLAKVAENLDEFFDIMAESLRDFGKLPEEVCEDRSLNGNDTETSPESCQEESPAALQRGKPGDTDDPEPSLTLFYELLVNPVSDLLNEPEIIIVPDRNLYRVPFPALLDESGKYLSERFRIRVVPSLTTLKLIQDSPADYHCQTGALVVGDPDVGEVIYMGCVNRKFVPLPGARKEAEMIARRLGVWPLLGQDATKKAVLEKLNSVSLIHIAAHGNAERGEIALAPLDPVPRGCTTPTRISQEDDYLLKMSDISKVKVRAKLVVLSCCHSGRGQIRAEGVVGIARAFLGAGARSVLVALWALDDRATKKLMSLFYEHLIQGESASKSLHAAMKWLRDHGFTKVSRWAPFMLIGDDVTFEFEK